MKIDPRSFETWLLGQEGNAEVGDVTDAGNCPIYHWLSETHDIRLVTTTRVLTNKGLEYYLPRVLVDWHDEAAWITGAHLDIDVPTNLTRNEALIALYRAMLIDAGVQL